MREAVNNHGARSRFDLCRRYFAGEGACFTSTVTAPATPGLTVNTWPLRVS